MVQNDRIIKLSKTPLRFSELSNARKEANEAKRELNHTKEILNNLTTRMRAQHVALSGPHKEEVKNR